MISSYLRKNYNLKCICSIANHRSSRQKIAHEFLSVICCFFLSSSEMKRWEFGVQRRAGPHLNIKAREHPSKNSMQIGLCSSIYVTERLHVQKFHRIALSVWASNSIVLLTMCLTCRRMWFLKRMESCIERSSASGKIDCTYLFLNDFPIISINPTLCKWGYITHNLSKDLINAGLADTLIGGSKKRTVMIWLKLSLFVFLSEVTDNFNLQTPSAAHISEVLQLYRSWISLETLAHPASCPQRTTEEKQSYSLSTYLPRVLLFQSVK